MSKPFIVGIDLGTTNSAVSFVDMTEEGARAGKIRLFEIPQLIGAGEFAKHRVLPSFLYISGKYDIDADAIQIPWKTESDNFVGTFARDHGAKVPARLVSSAKSWLCHSNVDRHARILPWGSGKDVYNVSPIEATAAFLNHIRKAWNQARGDNEDFFLENQTVIITAPASFDEVARDLTLEAAAMAGLKEVTLLEEPLAAFYSWLVQHEKNWSDFVSPNDLILICDVGGGTTDFTLITLRETDGSPRFERIAVGDHLILGGDNVDLALARQVEAGIRGKKSGKAFTLSPDKWKTLCHECRQAKELILDGKAESKKITIIGEGKKLISGTISAELDAATVEETVLSGFFPMVNREEVTEKPARKGISEFGLPYEPEPAITRHIGRFLERHSDAVKQMLGRDSQAPDRILFNGGSLKPNIIQERIRSAIRYWFGITDDRIPSVLENPDPDLAVSLGAAYYGLVKRGKGVRVGSGSPRSYFLGVAARKQDGKDEKQAICLVERGLDEGRSIEIEENDFEVLTNQPVSFELYSSSFRSGDRCGDIVSIDDSLTTMPPIQTVVRYGKKGIKKRIPVTIEAQYTEMGTLALWCNSRTSDHKWRLQFQLRDTPAAAVSEQHVFDEAVIDQIKHLIQNAFQKGGDPDSMNRLAKRISKVVERPKKEWPLSLIRNMADAMIPFTPEGPVPHQYESKWMNLAGFCLRPGFGDGFDAHRIDKLWRLHTRGPVNEKNPQVRNEWWIFWRRIAGGLNAGRQRQFIQNLAGILSPKKGGKKIPPHEMTEIWMVVANLERLLVKDKLQWGRKLLSDINPKKSPPQYLWALSRLGARELLYGPSDRVIEPDNVAVWIEKLMKMDWKNPSDAVSAIARMARKTGDRTRDIDQHLLDRIEKWMAGINGSKPFFRMIQEVVPMEKQEENAAFGESLPSGLVIRLDAQGNHS